MLCRRNNAQFLRKIYSMRQFQQFCMAASSSQLKGTKMIGFGFRNSQAISSIPRTFSTSNPRRNFELDKPKPSASSKSESEELPEILLKQCQKWEQAVRAEQEVHQQKQKMNSENQWLNCKLKLVNCLHGLRTTRMLSEENKKILKTLHLRVPVRLHRFPRNECGDELDGAVYKHFRDANNDINAIMIKIGRRITLDEEIKFKGSTFDIMIDSRLEKQLEFLGTTSEWHAMPGYNAMLCAFKCKPLPSSEEMGPDPTEWIGEKEKSFFDNSQLEALSAALNPNRPIVAIHGGPGTGKTRLLIENVQQLRKQGMSVIVFSKSLASVYKLVDNYYKETGDIDFHIMEHFSERLAHRLIPDINFCAIMKKRTFIRLTEENQEDKTRKYFGMVQTLESEIEGAARRGKLRRKINKWSAKWE